MPVFRPKPLLKVRNVSALEFRFHPKSETSEMGETSETGETSEMGETLRKWAKPKLSKHPKHLKPSVLKKYIYIIYITYIMRHFEFMLIHKIASYDVPS